MVMAGSEDKLMGVKLMKDMTNEYRDTLAALGLEKKVDSRPSGDGRVGQSGLEETQDGIEESSEGGAIIAVVEGAGHHLQNDVKREVGAEAFRRFVDQI